MNGNIKQTNKQGYTLLELIVVLALLSIILSIAAPSIRVIGKFEEKMEMKTFRKDIISAKNKAITEGTMYALFIERENNRYLINSGGKTIKYVKFKHWEILPGNTFNNRIKFLAAGSPDRGGSLRLKNKKGKIIKLTIVPVTGKLNMYEE